jgi:predicted AAA+ superfamily ATPase
MKLINRQGYLNWLIRWKDHDLVKVVSGVRRCGKSTLFRMFIEYLVASGVDPSRILAINFEHIENEHLTDYRSLLSHISSWLGADDTGYVFLDEIQQVHQFEKAINSLSLNPRCDIYITGSNAYFMSSELATLLSGRYVELRMLPLSLKEFSTGLDDIGSLSDANLLDRYMAISSFPYAINFAGHQLEATEYLRDIYSTVLLKDVVARSGIADVTSLENVTRFLLHNVGNRVSVNKIANTLSSTGRKVSNKTVDKYIRSLCDSLILYEARRYDIKGRSHLTTLSKYYCVDVALRNMLAGSAESDIGQLLENIVYLELMRRGFDVYVGQHGETEVDFVAVEAGGGIIYIQVAATTLDEAVLARELAPLRLIADNHPKYLLTLDEVFKTANYDGIIKNNVIDWLLEA